MSPETDPDRAGLPTGRTALVDAHVHFHPSFDEHLFLRAAAANFEAAARDLRLDGAWEAILVLTEVAGRDYFDELRSRAWPRGADAPGNGPEVRETEEPSSIRVRLAHAHLTLTVIGGRQIQTQEGLEVLAFPLRDEVPDGLPIRSALLAAHEREATAVIPWGPGKWSLRRGRLLRQLTDERDRGEHWFLLADTGHRPAWAPTPAPLRTAARNGAPCLTGSDPLPLPGEASRAGSCCFEIVLDDGIETEPCRALRRALRRALDPRADELRRVERRPGLLHFAGKQMVMQVRKRLLA